MMDIDINTDKLRELRDFVYLSEGVEELDDAVRDLDTIIEYVDAKNGNYDFPSYEMILATCLEDMNEDDAYIVSLPLGYHVEFIRDKIDSIWAEFYDKDDAFVKRLLFWDKLHTEEIRQVFEYYIDHFYDNIL